MSYSVKDYMTKEVITINSELTVMEAAKVMASDKNFGGYTIVLKDGKPVGMLTERDVINEVIAKELDASKIKISKVMSSPLITIDPYEDLLKASYLMQKHNVRKLVIVQNEIICGILTAKDIALHCGNYVDRSIKDIIRWTAPLGI